MLTVLCPFWQATWRAVWPMASSTSTLDTCWTRSWRSSVRPLTANQWICSRSYCQFILTTGVLQINYNDHYMIIYCNKSSPRRGHSTHCSQSLIIADVDISTVFQKSTHALFLPKGTEHRKAINMNTMTLCCSFLCHFTHPATITVDSLLVKTKLSSSYTTQTVAGTSMFVVAMEQPHIAFITWSKGP